MIEVEAEEEVVVEAEVEAELERTQQRDTAAAAYLFVKPLGWPVGREGGKRECMGFYFLRSGILWDIEGVSPIWLQEIGLKLSHLLEKGLVSLLWSLGLIRTIYY